MKNKVIFGVKIAFIVLIVVWIFLVLIDYFNVRGERNPQFCLKEEVHVFDAEGKLSNTLSMEDFNKFTDSQKAGMLYTYECVGLGYKAYRYNREFKAIEFGPFFIKERTSAE